MFWIILFIVALVSSGISIIFSLGSLTALRVIEIVLRNILFFSVGISGLIGFYGHAFIPEKVAKGIGWEPGSPFQYEVAIMNLSLGVLGILCCWFKGYFWLATALSSITIMVGCGIGHLKELLNKKNKAPYNAGLGIWLQTAIMPILLAVLTVFYLTLR